MKGKMLIIQLTRIGDLIQTMQAVRQFKACQPDVQVDLLARPKFAKGLEFLLEAVFDRIYYINTKEILADSSFQAGITELKGLLANINQNNYDVSVNLSFNKSSSYLHTLVEAKQKLGIQRNSRTEVVVNDPWSQFVFSSVMRGANTPFNLVDLFRYILGLKEMHVLSPGVFKRENKIILHPFASARKKRWGASKWVELIFKLSKEFQDYTFHLVGGSEDIEECSKILSSPALERIQHRLNSHVGNFSIAQTYQLLEKSKLVIAHDSMVSHLAAESSTPTIVLSLGTVRPQETTPYSENVVNIVPRNSCFPCEVKTSCELLPCHSSLNHQAISHIAKTLINGKREQLSETLKNISPFQIGNSSIFVSEYCEHGLAIREITKNNATIEGVFKNFYKIIFQYYLRGVDIKDPLPNISRETASHLSRYLEGTNYLYELFNFGVKYCNQIIKKSEGNNPSFKDIQEDINKLAEIDSLCQVTKQTYPLLANIVDFFYVSKANGPGGNLNEIAKSNLLCYYDASNLVAVLSDFIKRSAEQQIHLGETGKEV